MLSGRLVVVAASVALAACSSKDEVEAPPNSPQIVDRLDSGSQISSNQDADTPPALLDAQDIVTLRLPALTDPLPNRLSDLGLFPSAADLSTVADGVFQYEPRWPLWSNGSEKLRAVAVTGADPADDPPTPEELPQGTVFFKTFAFPEHAGSSRFKPVETRIMRLNGEWEFVRYRWDDAGSDATRIESVQAVDVVVSTDEGISFEHQIPSERDCRRCHEASESPVLGYRSIQLGNEALAFEDSETAEVAGYFYGNCSHCHNGLASDLAAFDLRPGAFMRNTINHPMEDTDAIGTRIVPGDPEASLLWVALNGGDADQFVDRMPLIGVQVSDERAVERVRAWIENLVGEEYCDADCPDCIQCLE